MMQIRGLLRAVRHRRKDRESSDSSGNLKGYWSLSPAELSERLATTPQGLPSEEASRRLLRYGFNDLREHRTVGRLQLLWNQLRSPLLLLLVAAAAASLATREWVDAALVMAIVAATAAIGFVREHQAQTAAGKLLARIQIRTSLVRDGVTASLPVREVVPGDVVLLSAGKLVPADGVVLESTDCFVNQAVLTGESFPVEKTAGPSPTSAPIQLRTNCVFLGTNVTSGTARCLVVETGARTQFGAIARRLTLRPPETEFDRGLRHFGYTLARWMLVMVVVVFAANAFLGRPLAQTLLFSIALAVGLSPELLPAILSVSLARGARMMARHGVLVRRLNAIENLGSMDVLCTDKTGTLTEGVIHLENAYDVRGQPSADVLESAARNASLQAGLANPLDHAILGAHPPNLAALEKLAEVPYDFVRKRLSVVYRGPDGVRLVAKGAVAQVLRDCVACADGAPLDARRLAEIEQLVRTWSDRGSRILAVAERRLGEKQSYGRDDERELQLVGFLTFVDRPKEGASKAISDLKNLGVSVKIITGDSRFVAQHVAAALGLGADRVLTGQQLDELHDEALWRAAEETDLFAEVDPNQKERIILSLKKTGHVVGFLGDGVNDAPAMHAADTSLSVDRAADVAREAADFVLLERDLGVIRRGIEEGRRTFANTLKYVLITMSANLGNMLSMAAASLFLPFLPLLAPQILLNNLLSDVPALGLADDSVDQEMVDRPRRWDMRFIRRFMVEFGLLSSAFDALTFFVLLVLLAAGAALFRTGWFVESLLTEVLVALVVRTRRPLFRSRPGNALLVSTLAVAVFAVAVPYVPLSGLLGFTPLSTAALGMIIAIAVLYVIAAELLKRRFFRRLR